MQGSATSTGAASPAPIDARQQIDNPLWYRDAVIYQLHVRGFFDSNDDGIGDFPRADAEARLHPVARRHRDLAAALLSVAAPRRRLRHRGLPRRPSELRHPTGLPGVHECRARSRPSGHHGARDQPHLRSASLVPGGAAGGAGHVEARLLRLERHRSEVRGCADHLQGHRASNWTWDPVASQYFWHRFFHHQPDLNFDNPHGDEGGAARHALLARHGRRRHAPRRRAVSRRARRHPVREPARDARHPESHSAASSTSGIRAACCSPKPISGRPTCARISATATNATWRSTSRSCRACTWRSGRKTGIPISEILYQMPEIPDTCQWAIFLRNHDELTLEMVSDDERDYMYQAYAADPQMRVNAGIRRRLAPLMENSRPRIELLTGLLLSLPGTPVLYYGDELGMGDNVYLGDRNGVRTPMQWNADRNGGFSRADPARLYAPPIMDSIYGYRLGQRRGAGPLAAFAARLDASHRRASASATSRHSAAGPSSSSGRPTGASWPSSAGSKPTIPCSSSPTSRGRCRRSRSTSRDSQAWSRSRCPAAWTCPRITDAPYVLTLGPFAFYWLRLQREAPSNLVRGPAGRSRRARAGTVAAARRSRVVEDFRRQHPHAAGAPASGRLPSCGSRGSSDAWRRSRESRSPTGERCRTATSQCSSWC